MLKYWIGLFFCMMTCGYPSVELEEEKSLTSFEWGLSKSELSSARLLKDRWIHSMLQECIQEKLKESFIDEGIEFEFQVEEGLLPCSFASIFDAKSLKSELLEKIKEKTDIDFSQEFHSIKGKWKKWIDKYRKAGYFPNWSQDFSFPSYFTFEDFLDASEKILWDIELYDLLLVYHEPSSILKSALYEIENIRDSSSDLYLSSHAMRGWDSAASASRGGQPKSEEARRFFELPVSDEELVLIRKIITNMAEKNVVQLLLDKKTMERKGDRIHPVHPMRFAGIVLTDPHLRRCMRSITKSMFKWNGFLDGYEKRMKEEARSGTLICYASGLADLLEVDRGVIVNFLHKGDYGGLIKHFL